MSEEQATTLELPLRRLGILDRESCLVGYELRSADDVAVIQAVLDCGLERLVGERRAFFRVPDPVGQASRVPFPSRCSLVAEPARLDRRDRHALLDRGFQLVADGPDIETAELDGFTFARLKLGDDPRSLAGTVARLSNQGVRVVADGIRSHAGREAALEIGVELLSGRWFEQPRAVDQETISPNRLNLMRLLAAANDPDASLQDLEELVSQDVALSYRLVRVVNSPAFCRGNPVESIGQAVMMLGFRRLSTWVQLLGMSGIEGKPTELMVLAMVRASMCERLASLVQHPSPDALFTVGLFSVLDALFDRPMSQVLEGLNLSDEIVAALVSRSGDAGEIFACVHAHERGSWETVNLGTLELADIMTAYLESVIWTDEMMALLADLN